MPCHLTRTGSFPCRGRCTGLLPAGGEGFTLFSVGRKLFGGIVSKFCEDYRTGFLPGKVAPEFAKARGEMGEKLFRI